MQENELENAKKRLLMRAEHRGMKEMDIIIGGYVRAQLSQLSAVDVVELEELLNIDDQTLYAILVGNRDAHEEFADRILKIQRFIGL